MKKNEIILTIFKINYIIFNKTNINFNYFFTFF